MQHMQKKKAQLSIAGCRKASEIDKDQTKIRFFPEISCLPACIQPRRPEARSAQFSFSL
jgi:hypothetical protein